MDTEEKELTVKQLVRISIIMGGNRAIDFVSFGGSHERFWFSYDLKRAGMFWIYKNTQ